MTDMITRFVHISDTHMLAPGQGFDYSDIDEVWADYARQVLALPYSPNDAVEALVREINALPFAVDGILHTGDVSHHPLTEDAYRFAAEKLRAIRVPVMAVPGNHDTCEGFSKLLGGRAAPYELDWHGVQLVGLDSRGSNIPHAGWLDDGQLTWLDEHCAPDDARPLIVAVHHHPFPVGVSWLDELQLVNGEALHEVLVRKRKRLRAVLYGHIHTGIQLMRDGILYSSAPSAWVQFPVWPGCPRPALDERAGLGFNIVTVIRDGVSVQQHSYRIGRERA